MFILTKVGQNIVSLRKQKGITQEHLALYSDISVYYLRQIEHGTANPTLLILDRLAEILEIPTSDILI